MRIWDVHPGFLNDRSLLGEHRELHGIFSIIKNNKKGYSRHPETLRWVSKLGALSVRHDMLVAEMFLRGFNHHSLLNERSEAVVWPDVFIDSPADQYNILKKKYTGKGQGRIPLPEKSHQMWASHKYSVMARDPQTYKEIGPRVSADDISYDELARLMVDFLRTPPLSGRLANAILHMWGYVSTYSFLHPPDVDLHVLMAEIQKLAKNNRIGYLLQSTALSDFMIWLSLLNWK